jgi:hypothetical protein
MSHEPRLLANERSLVVYDPQVSEAIRPKAPADQTPAAKPKRWWRPG